MAAKRQIYLDLDRTLFETDRAANRFMEVCHEAYGLDVEQMKRDMIPFYCFVGTQRFYKFFDQLATYGIKVDEAQEIISKGVQNDDFLYSDGRALLEYLRSRAIVPKILSLGDERFQTFKFSLVPELRGFDIICTEALKGEYFMAHAENESMLIDDKYVDGLPATCQGVLVDRTQKIALQKTDTGYVIINDLRVAERLIVT